MASAAAAVAGPSRLPPPSTSGDSESTAVHAHAHRAGPDVGVLRELGKQALVEALNDIQGTKTLVLDPALAGPLGLVIDVASLKHHGVDKMFWLEPGLLTVNTRNVIWLCRPKRAHMRVIAEQVRAAPGLQYTALLVPRATELCRRVLEDEGVAGDITVSEFKLELIPIEDDVLSMELEDVSRDVFLRGDETPIYYAALALNTLQRAFGTIPRVIAKGDAAKKLATLMEQQRPDVDPSTDIDSIIILDRAVDWVSPMCTQLTYEGMLDEFIGISHAHIEVEPNLLDPNAAPGSKKRKQHLAASDKLFHDIRDLNFAVVGARLSKLARRLEGDFAGAKKLESVSQMKDFTGKLGSLKAEQQSLRLHTALTERLMPVTQTPDFNKALEAQQNLVAGYDPLAQLAIIEDLLLQQAPLSYVLRSAVLLSLTSGGIKPKSLETFKRDFLQTYGYHHLPLLVALQDLGLLVKAPAPTPFAAARKPFRLVVDDVDDSHPDDISYVYSGYAPLSIRLVQAAAQRSALTGDAKGDIVRSEGKRPPTGFKGLEAAVAAIPGAVVDSNESTPHRQPRSESRRTTLVFFLGGCTYTEIAALRFMSKQHGRRFMVATTGMINGTTLLNSFGDAEPVPLQRR
ncbi:Vacuolar protein sorting-associated protein 33A [Vanrija pseudolonga]|uniref:Vacuolar protein sorting-associated protein 33A n=1 Tax=Vanrija pseudolonga TaxID=143232 RepID=A0AAF1BIU4_9TREE|nr:Vacuolar protein sorting-associated protein 33A [Vanrija pseudolonga]